MTTTGPTETHRGAPDPAEPVTLLDRGGRLIGQNLALLLSRIRRLSVNAPARRNR